MWMISNRFVQHCLFVCRTVSFVCGQEWQPPHHPTICLDFVHRQTRTGPNLVTSVSGTNRYLLATLCATKLGCNMSGPCSPSDVRDVSLFAPKLGYQIDNVDHVLCEVTLCASKLGY